MPPPLFKGYKKIPDKNYNRTTPVKGSQFCDKPYTY